MSLAYLIAKIRVLLCGGNALINYYRRCGMKIGVNPRIFSDIITSEPYLISIGNNVTISAGVQFITHDNSVIKCIPNATDIFGEIAIGDNCFIGARSLILYGVTLPDNTVVAAGSVVTKSISESGKIIGGNPAKIIGNINDLAKKYSEAAVNMKGKTKKDKYDMLIGGIVKLVKR